MKVIPLQSIFQKEFCINISCVWMVWRVPAPWRQLDELRFCTAVLYVCVNVRTRKLFLVTEEIAKSSCILCCWSWMRVVLFLLFKLFRIVNKLKKVRKVCGKWDHLFKQHFQVTSLKWLFKTMNFMYPKRIVLAIL